MNVIKKNKNIWKRETIIQLRTVQLQGMHFFESGLMCSTRPQKLSFSSKGAGINRHLRAGWSRDRGSFNLITSRGLIEEIKVAALVLDIIHRGRVSLYRTLQK